MTFALSYHPNVPALLAGPRLFIGPDIPGYVGAGGRVMMPMTLDGRLTDTGARSDDVEGLERFLNRHEDRFVSASARIRLSKSREHFEAAVHPRWLTGILDWIKDDRDRYEKVLDSHPLQRIALQTVKGQMGSLAPLFSGCLYLGDGQSGDRTHFLLPHDLGLYGKPVRPKEGDLFPVLELLETFCLAHEQLRTGMEERIVVRRARGDTTHRIGGRAETHGAFMEFLLPEGAVLKIPREQIQPVAGAAANGAGNVYPYAMKGEGGHPAYVKLHLEMLQRSAVFLGCLLLIHYEIDGPLMEALLRRLDGASHDNLRATPQHLQLVLEQEMHELGHHLSRDEQGFEGRCLLKALQALDRVV